MPNTYRDPVTGAVVHQITDHPSINHATYFLQSSFTPDNRTLIFISYRSGCAQLFEIPFPDGEPRQLTSGAAIHPFSGNEGGYINFMAGDDADRVEANFGRNYGRLREVKTVYDPANLFHLNQNIKPAG